MYPIPISVNGTRGLERRERCDFDHDIPDELFLGYPEVQCVRREWECTHLRPGNGRLGINFVLSILLKRHYLTRRYRNDIYLMGKSANRSPRVLMKTTLYNSLFTTCFPVYRSVLEPGPYTIGALVSYQGYIDSLLPFLLMRLPDLFFIIRPKTLFWKNIVITVSVCPSVRLSVGRLLTDPCDGAVHINRAR